MGSRETKDKYLMSGQGQYDSISPHLPLSAKGFFAITNQSPQEACQRPELMQ